MSLTHFAVTYHRPGSPGALPRARAKHVPAGPLGTAFLRLAALRLRWGLVHLPGVSGLRTLPAGEFPSPEPRVFAASLSRPAFLSAMARELEELTEASSDFARAHRERLSSVPLIVISRSPLWSPAGPPRQEPTAESRAWIEAHARLASRSRLGRLITAEVAGHDVHVDEPDLVVGAVQELLQGAGTDPDPSPGWPTGPAGSRHDDS